MIIRFAAKSDDILKISNLIFETDAIIPFLFGKRNLALLKIKALIEKEDNAFSYKNILLYLNETNSIRGVLLFYAPQQKNQKSENEDYFQVFSTFELIKLWLKSLILNSIFDKSEIDGIYIQNICVDSSARGEGIGTKLILHIEKYAKKSGYTSLWLDVSFENPKAKKLYEKLGFTLESKHRILFSKNGFFRMKKNLTPPIF